MVEKTGKRRPAREQDRMIMEALRGIGQPVSAYQLIEELRGKAILAPQSVYRSLDRLIADGLAHRLESLNAFVACRHPSHRGAAIFAIAMEVVRVFIYIIGGINPISIFYGLILTFPIFMLIGAGLIWLWRRMWPKTWGRVVLITICIFFIIGLLQAIGELL